MAYTDDKPKPTCKVSFYGVHCYLHEPTNALWGVNQACDWLIFPMAALHNVFATLVPGAGRNGFVMKVLERYDESNQPKTD